MEKYLDLTLIKVIEYSWLGYIIDEDLVHALWYCKFARRVWKCSPFCQLVGTQRVCSFMDLFYHVRTTFQEEDLCLFAVIVWMIWAERNKSFHGGIVRDPFAVYEASLVFYKDFVDLCPSPKLPRHVATCCWNPPEGDLLKLNVDGACCVADRKMGLGAVVRNANGELMGAMAKPVIGCLSPKAFETLAMIAGCRMAIDAGFTRLIIESDCLEVINAVNRSEFDMSMEGELIEELKELLRRFVSVSLQHQPRTCNFVAHQLAKFALSCNETCYWMEEGPSWLHSYLQNDLRSLHSIEE